MSHLDCAGKVVDLSVPQVMGILNVTPDSFSDGGKFISVDAAIRQAQTMVEEGVAIIDIGGESTRPGASPVSVQDELDRVIPVIEALRELPVPLSIDTSKPQVMKEAVGAGASMINDVNALQAEGAVEIVASLNVPVCLMHMQGEPPTMQQTLSYEDVVKEVNTFLSDRIDACINAGISRDRLVVDPGFGFGKTPAHNFTLIKHLNTLTDLGCPVLVGVSLKSTIGALLDDAPVEQRLYASVALAAIAVLHGASIIRAHDVKPTIDAIRAGLAVVNAV